MNKRNNTAVCAAGICCALALFLAFSSCTQDNSLKSPNGEIKISLNTVNPKESAYGSISFTVEHLNGQSAVTVLDHAKLGLKTQMQDFSENLCLVSTSEKKFVKDDYRMITGKRSHCTNEAYERTYRFENDRQQTMEVTFRAYNDGVAFRYTVQAPGETDAVMKELTSYPIAEGTKRWIQTYDPTSYERFYPKAIDGSSKSKYYSNLWGYPALVERDASVFLLITEANILRDHCASRLNNVDNNNEYLVDLATDTLPFQKSWTSPWRVLIIGSLADIVESTLVTDVSEPATFTDTDWIKPAPAAWIYWANNHGTKDFQIVKEYIDLAVKMQWPYNLIDWEWDEMSNGGNIEDAIKYSLEKGIQPLMWYNSGTNWIGPGAPGPQDRLITQENRRKEYAWLNEMGVVGIKVDFFKGDDVGSMNYQIDLLEDAAKYKIMINFHGATIPRGWQRTYPHMMTIEGVYGAEWYNNAPILTKEAASHNATLPFTRNVVDPMDYTPGTFSDSQHPHITSHGHELALTVAFESALQHMPDRPSAYLSLPESVKSFLSHLPTAWDDTKLLSGYPGEEVVIARRKGNTWYIAGLNGTDLPRKLAFTPAFLNTMGNTMTLFKDGKDDRSFNIEADLSLVDSTVAIELDCLPRGGFVAVIK